MERPEGNGFAQPCSDRPEYWPKMRVPVRSLVGLADMPSHRTSLTKFLVRVGVYIHQAKGAGGKFEYVHLTDLPDHIRQAYLLRQLEADGLEPGEFDPEWHEDLLAATPAMQNIAERKANIARDLIKLGADRGQISRDIVQLVQVKHGDKGTDKATLKRLLKAVEGVDPANFAPALLPSYSRDGRRKAKTSNEAWSFFMTTIRDAAPDFPISQAWRDVRDVATSRSWNWPSLPTIQPRWNALSPAQRLEARFGREEAARRLAQPIIRDKSTLRPLDIASLDGRTQDYWVDFGDGRPVRPTMLILVDVATNFILGYEISRSENSETTARLIRETCVKHGIFRRLYPDNGSAFAGHLVAGGAGFKWRKSSKDGKLQPIGVCRHFGIEITFAIPKNAKAKIAERVFGILSRCIDDRPELRGAHAGHAPGATISSEGTAIAIDDLVPMIEREINRYNREPGRRNAGAKGRSYEEQFAAGIKDQPVSKPTIEQLYYASLVYVPVAVDRFGRVAVKTWVYGDYSSQPKLLKWHKKGQILIGYNPEKFEDPAVAIDQTGRLIATDIQPVVRGKYDSQEGARQASRNRKEARQAVAKAIEANDYLTDAEMSAALAALKAPSSALPDTPAKVVAVNTSSPVRAKRSANAKANQPSGPTHEMIENFDRVIGFDPSRYSGSRSSG